MLAVKLVVVVVVMLWGGSGGLVTSDLISNSQLEEQQYPREWPCPIATDIWPCVCHDFEDYNMTMDCSDVLTDDQLVNAFRDVVFPFIHFLEFKIIHTPDNPDDDLTTIGLGTLGDTTYEVINIHGTQIQTIEDEAFANSHDYLRTLDLSGNKISSYPFESVNMYSQLRTFRIDSNRFLSLPPIESATLEVFGADDNKGIVLQPAVFSGSPALREIYLARCDMSTLIDYLVTNQTNLEILDLEENEISTLELNTVSPLNPSIKTINLSKNKISYIRHDAIQGLRTDAVVLLTQNNITQLYADQYQHIFDQLDPPGNIDFTGNELLCGCDMAWIQLDEVHGYLELITPTSTCSTGEQVIFLPPSFFVDQCIATPEPMKQQLI